MDPGSLLKAIMGPVEVKMLLSLGGWLSHDKSCLISYFYISGFLVILGVVVVVLVYLGRTGRLQPAKQQVTAGIRTIRNTIRVRSTPTGINVSDNLNYYYCEPKNVFNISCLLA